MKLQTYISRFNTPDTHLVVSSWPDRHAGKEAYHGDAAFTRESLKTLVKTKGMRFVVLAETNHNNSPELLENGNILVLRVFDHGKFHLYPTILFWLAKFPEIRDVMVHSNFTYSGIKHFIALIPFLALIKSTGRTVTHVAHNVMDSLDFLATQLNITNPMTIDSLNAGVKLYNRLLGIIVDHLVVLDASGYKILSKYIPKEKLIYSPHWVKPRTTGWSKTEAKKSLGIATSKKVILCFGFISWYKGSDRLVNLFKALKNNVSYELVFAGGMAPSMAQQEHYKNFYDRFTRSIHTHSNIRVTGFIPDTEIGKYFASSDIVILPYRGLMGGSGALSWAIGYNKPFLLSTDMRSIWSNPDFKATQGKAHLTKEHIMFAPTVQGFQSAIKRIGSMSYMKKLKLFSTTLRSERNIEQIMNTLYTRIYTDDTAAYQKNPSVRSGVYGIAPTTQ